MRVAAPAAQQQREVVTESDALLALPVVEGGRECRHPALTDDSGEQSLHSAGLTRYIDLDILKYFLVIFFSSSSEFFF